MSGLPAGIVIGIEFVKGSGTFTDVTADVDASVGFTINKGRTSEFSAPQVGNCSFTLWNDLGTYTPNAQLLVDGVTAAPYYPNIKPRLRVKISYTISAVTYVRFLGYVSQWAPQVDGDSRPFISVTANDRQAQLANIGLLAPMAQEISQDYPLAAWALTDAVGASTAVDMSGHNRLQLAVAQSGAGGPLVFGGNGPGPEDGTGVAFAPASTSNGQYLTAHVPWWPQPVAPTGWLPSYSIEVWVNTTVSQNAAIWSLQPSAYGSLQMAADGTVHYISGVAVDSSVSVKDGSWHHIVCTYSSDGTTVDGNMYIDGVVQTTKAVNSMLFNQVSGIILGQIDLTSFASALWSGEAGYLTVYDHVLTAGRIAAHAAAGVGFAGDTTGARIARFLTWAGLTSADWNLDPGVAVVGHYQTSSQTVLQGCQDMATTEGGGSCVYVGSDGRVRFCDRNFRKPAAAVVTVDAAADLDVGGFAPSYDDQNLVNQVTGSRNSGSGVASTQVVTDPVSIAAYNLASASVTSWAVSDADVLALSQYQLAAQSEPGVRLPQVTIDLVTATSAGLYQAIAAAQIGSRLRVTNLPAGAVTPATQLDVICEGWHETSTIDTYSITFDASPADNPPFAVWDDATYFRWQPVDGAITLNAAITAAATSLTTAGTSAALSTVSGSYPLTIQIGEEQMTVTTAPAASTAPQTLAVTRAANGTPAAPQAAGAVVSLAPATRWAL